MKQRFPTSFFILVLLCLILASFRLCHVSTGETSWDVLGYYLYLPATFIHHDPMLSDITWLTQVNEQMELTGTLYQVTTTPQGEPMYFFLMGMAVFYLPFFFLGHGMAAFTSFPQDGFSLPYQYALVIGGIVYTIIGLVFFRKIMRLFFSERLTSILLVLLVLATNYAHHMSLKNLETVNILFTLSTLVIWYSNRWHQNFKFKNLLAVAVASGLMVLVKPSEGLIVLVFLLWGVSGKESLRNRIHLFKAKWRQLMWAAIAGILVLLPQLLYWFASTGSFIYDSYKNPGVGLDIFTPHVFETLFSFRKGWLIYTPLMIFALIGFSILWKRNRGVFWPAFLYFILSFWIISSWTEWWYGAGFSNRPLIVTYPILFISLGYFLESLPRPGAVKTGFVVLFSLLLFLNIFQWWQVVNWVIHPYRTTAGYYFSVFLKTEPPPGAGRFLLVDRDFSGKHEFSEPWNYNLIETELSKINWPDKGIEETELGKAIASGGEEFILSHGVPYNKLSEKDHLWIEATGKIKMKNAEDPFPYFVVALDRKGKNYGYFAPQISGVHEENGWVSYSVRYMTPPIRSTKDRVIWYLWNPGHSEFLVIPGSLRVYERKPPLETR